MELQEEGIKKKKIIKNERKERIALKNQIRERKKEKMRKGQKTEKRGMNEELQKNKNNQKNGKKAKARKKKQRLLVEIKSKNEGLETENVGKKERTFKE